MGKHVRRTIEILKSRAPQAGTNRAFLTISSDYGVRIISPLPVSDISSLDYSTIYYTGCPEFDEAVGGIPRGAQIFITYPAGFSITSHLIAIITQYILRYNLKALFVSYALSEEDIRYKIHSVPRKIITDRRKIDEFIKVKSFNSASISLYDLYALGQKIINETNPDLWVLHGLINLYNVYGYSRDTMLFTYISSLSLRERGIIVFRKVTYRKKNEYHPALEYSDIILRVSANTEGYDLEV